MQLGVWRGFFAVTQLGDVSPAKIRSTELLPAPLAPRMPILAPRYIPKDTCGKQQTQTNNFNTTQSIWPCHLAPSGPY